MTVLSDFVVLTNDAAAASNGKWRSDAFETGGRLTRSQGGTEFRNAYIGVTLTSPQGGSGDIAVRVIVNDHPLPQLIEVKGNSQRTALISFPASFLNPQTGDHNIVGLHSQGERPFIVLDAVCHFRQNS
jgi:hypothetical protein